VHPRGGRAAGRAPRARAARRPRRRLDQDLEALLRVQPGQRQRDRPVAPAERRAPGRGVPALPRRRVDAVVNDAHPRARPAHVRDAGVGDETGHADVAPDAPGQGTVLQQRRARRRERQIELHRGEHCREPGGQPRGERPLARERPGQVRVQDIGAQATQRARGPRDSTRAGDPVGHRRKDDVRHAERARPVDQRLNPGRPVVGEDRIPARAVQLLDQCQDLALGTAEPRGIGEVDDAAGTHGRSPSRRARRSSGPAPIQ